MKRVTMLASALLMSTMLAAGAAQAKTLVYCSEGSPEGFDPALYTAGTTFNASSRPVYNRLVEFERGTTNVQPGLAESWEVSADGLEYTFKLRKGVKFQTTDFFTPTRDFNADDVVFTFERQWKKDDPWNQYTAGAAWEYFDGMSMPDLLKEIVKVDDHTVKFVLNRPEAPMLANLGDGFRLDRVEGICRQARGRRQEGACSTSSRSAPVPSSSSTTRRTRSIRYKAHPDYWNGKPRDRRSGLRHHHRRLGARRRS